MARVLIMGAYGLLGTELGPALAAAGHEVFRQGRGGSAEYQADPGQRPEVERLLDRTRPQAVVNLMALTNVDECEADPRAAYTANVRTVEILAGCLRGRGVHLIQVSTDQVYDGAGPHDEDVVCPCNVYALSKYAGEMGAAAIGATIFRTNFVGRSRVPGRVAFSDWLVQSMRGQRPITLFDDVMFSALHTSVLGRFIEQAIRLKFPGTFNVGCADGLSKARFGLVLARLLGLDTSRVTVGRLADMKLKALRPLDMRLEVLRFEHSFGVTAPTMQETLDLVAKDYDHGL